jgi:ribosomal protein L37AE/L43A
VCCQSEADADLNASLVPCMAERLPKPHVCPVCKSKDIERGDSTSAPNYYRCIKCGSAWSMEPLWRQYEPSPRPTVAANIQT